MQCASPLKIKTVDMKDGRDIQTKGRGEHRGEELEGIAIQTIRVARNFLHPVIPVYTVRDDGGKGDRVLHIYARTQIHRCHSFPM